MREDGPRSQKCSPARLACFVVSNHCLMLSIFSVLSKQISQAQFLRRTRPLTLPLDVSVLNLNSFMPSSVFKIQFLFSLFLFFLSFFFLLPNSHTLVCTGEIWLRGFCSIWPSFFEAVSTHASCKPLHFNGCIQQPHFCLRNLSLCTWAHPHRCLDSAFLMVKHFHTYADECNIDASTLRYRQCACFVHEDGKT